MPTPRDLRHPGSPSPAVAILHERPEAVDYLVLGDTTLLLEESARMRVVSDDRLENVASIQHGAMHQHATGSATMTELRRVGHQAAPPPQPPRRLLGRQNRPGRPQHALTETAPRDRVQRAAVPSDGATRLVDRFSLLDWTDLLNVLAEQGPDAIIAQARAAEHSDPDGQRWPRGKRHDDASAAFCHLT